MSWKMRHKGQTSVQFVCTNTVSCSY